MDPNVNEETVIATGSTASGSVRKLILNILAIKNSLVECGHNSIVIDILKNFINIDNKKYYLPTVNGNGNSNSNSNSNGNGNSNGNNNRDNSDNNNNNN